MATVLAASSDKTSSGGRWVSIGRAATRADDGQLQAVSGRAKRVSTHAQGHVVGEAAESRDGQRGPHLKKKMFFYFLFFCFGAGGFARVN